jgi:hypothetical protein
VHAQAAVGLTYQQDDLDDDAHEIHAVVPALHEVERVGVVGEGILPDHKREADKVQQANEAHNRLNQLSGRATAEPFHHDALQVVEARHEAQTRDERDVRTHSLHKPEMSSA